MKSIGEVYNYIEITIVPYLRLLEKKMSTVKMVAWVYLITFVIALASGIYGNLSLFFVCFFILLASFYFMYKKGKISYGNFQKDVLEPLFSFIDPQIKYYQESRISEKEFANSHFVNEVLFTYKNKNYIIYRTQKYTLHCGDVEAKQYNGEDDTRTLYEGLFAYVNAPNISSGDIFVRSDFKINMLGSYIKKIAQPDMFNDLRKITIDDGEFDHAFTVYSSDVDEARRLFDDMRLRDILLSTSRKTQYGLQLTFSGNKIYIGIKMAPGFFAHGIDLGIDLLKSNSTYSSDSMKRSVEMFYAVVDIVEYLYQSNEGMFDTNR